MRHFLRSKDVLVKDFAPYVQEASETVKAASIAAAVEAERPLPYLTSPKTDKAALARALDREGIRYERRENCFAWIEDLARHGVAILGSRDVLHFLGRKLTGSLRAEVTSHLKRRPEGIACSTASGATRSRPTTNKALSSASKRPSTTPATSRSSALIAMS